VLRCLAGKTLDSEITGGSLWEIYFVVSVWVTMPSLSSLSICLRALFLCCSVLLIPGQSASQSNDRQQNLQHCMLGYADCNHSLLSSSEAAEVRAAEIRRNVQHCMLGYADCNHSLLSSSEAAEVRAAEIRRNVEHCRLGYADCNHSLLSSSEAAEVRAAEIRRNVQHCMLGYADCNHSLLSSSEAAEVRAAEIRRNVEHCRLGYADCNRSLLESQQNASPQVNLNPNNSNASSSPIVVAPIQERTQPALPPSARDTTPVAPGLKKETKQKVSASKAPAKTRKTAILDAISKSPTQTPPPPTSTAPPPSSTKPTTSSSSDSGFSTFTIIFWYAVALFTAYLVVRTWIRRRASRPTQPGPRTTGPASHPTSRDSISWNESNVPRHDELGGGWRNPPNVQNIDNGTNGTGNLCPVDARPLELGQQICRCNTPGCQTSYHRECWDFLVRENQGSCVHCRQASGVSSSVASTGPTRAPETDLVVCVQCGMQNRVNRWLPRVGFRCGRCRTRLFPGLSDSFATDIVGLDSVRQRVGQIVVFRGKVVEMRKVRGGSYLLKFENGPTNTAFKMYIPDRYVLSFRSRGIRIEDYLGSMIEVRGLVQRHPRWNHEIVVTEPNAVRTVATSERH
jgi:hypothetical protein